MLPARQIESGIWAKSMEGQITQVVLSLAGIVLLIVTLGIVAKKANRNGLVSAPSMRVVSSLSLGIKEKLVLIEVGNEQLVIAAGASGISKIHVLAEPVREDPQVASSITADNQNHTPADHPHKDDNGQDKQNSFRDQLESLLKQR